MEELFQLNPKIYKKKLCIFGTGSNAINTFIELESKGRRVECFADRDSECYNFKIFCNRPVLREDELINTDYIVIIASMYWQEIAERLLKKNICNLLIAPLKYCETYQITADEKYILRIGDIILRKDFVYICCPCGLGDTLYVAALVKAYKEFHSSTKKVCLIIKKNHMEVVSFFRGIDDTIISNEIVMSLYRYSNLTGEWRKENYIYGHFTSEWLGKYNLGYYKGNMITNYKKFIMQIPENSKIESPCFYKTNKNIKDFDKKTIILMPYAISSKVLPEYFWNNLVHRLKELGYKIYTNVKDDKEKPITGTRKISEAIDIMTQICESCLAVISVRSGMCDILSLTNAVLLVINVEEIHYKFWNLKNIVDDKKKIFNLNYYKYTNEDILSQNVLYILNDLNQ